MKPGSLVECIRKGGLWYDETTFEQVPGPDYKEIVTVQEVPFEGFLAFEEYDELDEDGEQSCFESKYFREIQPPMDIDALMKDEATKTHILELIS